MLLIYSVITFLILALAALSLVYLDLRKKSRLTDEKQQQTIALLKMQTIRSRLSPHFIFNALSALSGSDHNRETTGQTIRELMALLRRSVDNIEQPAIPLFEELEVVKGYIGLQSSRIPEPFTINFDIGPEVNMNQLIPAMIIQIPVENAIRHGIMKITGEKLMTIGIHPYDEGIQITVNDNGLGYSSSSDRNIGAGTGLKILYQSIFLLNSVNTHKITFTIKELNEEGKSQKGTSVIIRIPAIYSYDFFTDQSFQNQT